MKLIVDLIVACARLFHALSQHGKSDDIPWLLRWVSAPNRVSLDLSTLLNDVDIVASSKRARTNS